MLQGRCFASSLGRIAIHGGSLQQWGRREEAVAHLCHKIALQVSHVSAIHMSALHSSRKAETIFAVADLNRCRKVYRLTCGRRVWT